MRKSKAEKIGNIFEICIIVVFLVFSIVAFIAANVYNIRIISWNFHSKFSLIFSVGLFLIPLFFSQVKINISKKQEIWLVPVVLFLFSFLMRYYIIENIGINTHQVSDYEKAFQYGNPAIGLKGSGYEYFPTWGFYALILKMVFSLFGYSEFVGIMTNVVIQSMSVVLIYWSTYLISNKAKIAYYGAMFYALWPIHIFYNIVLSSEHYFIFSSLIATFLATLALYANLKSKWLKRLLIAGAGLFLSLSGLFKSLDKIMIIAIIALIIIAAIKGLVFNKNILAKMISSKKEHFILAIIFICFYYMMNFAGYYIMDQEVGIRVNKNPSAYYLAVGMNEIRNDWIGQDWQRYQELTIEYDHDYNKVSKIMYKELFEKLRNSNYIGISFFQEKFLMSWVHSGYFYWITETINDDSSVVHKDRWTAIWFPLSQYHWIITIFLCIVTSAAFIASPANRNHFVMFAMLTILGFAILSLFIGVQARYKCILYPQFSVLAGYGYFVIERFYNRIKLVVQK